MQYETPAQHQEKSLPDEAAHKLGSAQPDNDPFDAAAPSPARIPAERIPAENRPIEGLPREGIPAETQAGDFMTPDARPQDIRPRDVFPTELR